jgi:hypothetical protein
VHLADRLHDHDALRRWVAELDGAFDCRRMAALQPRRLMTLLALLSLWLPFLRLVAHFFFPSAGFSGGATGRFSSFGGSWPA